MAFLLSILLWADAGALAAAEVPLFREDFEDGNPTDGNPVTWVPGVPFASGSAGTVINGSYVLTAVAEGKQSEVWAKEFDSTGDVSIRAQVRGESPNRWVLSVFSHAQPDGRCYWAVLHEGQINLGSSWIHNRNIIAAAALPEGIDPWAEDVLIQFDAVGTNLSATVWRPGSPKPSSPQLTATAPSLPPGRVGFASMAPKMTLASFEAIRIGDSLHPNITQQPQGQTVLAGENVAFNVTAVGTSPFGYRWRKDGTVLNDATNATLTLTKVDESMAGLYSVVVTNVHGAVTSAPARLTVPPLFFKGQPQSQTVRVSLNATFSASLASAVPVSYRWRKGSTDLVDTERVHGAATSSLTLANVQPEDAGDYRVVAANAFGSITSQVAWLTVPLVWTNRVAPNNHVPGPQVKRTEDVIYGRKFGTALTLDVFEPAKKNSGAVLCMVSGGFFSSHEAINARAYAPFLDRGYTVFAIVHGSQPKFQIPEITQDIHRAVRFVRHNAVKWGVDPNKLGITGGSAGGHLSLTIGTRGGPGKADAKDPIDRENSAVQAVACLFPSTDLLNFGKPGEDAVGVGILAAFKPAFGPRSDTPEGRQVLGKEISPIYFITPRMPPTLIIHGDADQLVPIQQSEIFVTRAKDAGATVNLVVKAGAGHGWKDVTPDTTMFADWFDEHLRGIKPK